MHPLRTLQDTLWNNIFIPPQLFTESSDVYVRRWNRAMNLKRALSFSSWDQQWLVNDYKWAGHLTRLPSTRIAKTLLDSHKYYHRGAVQMVFGNQQHKRKIGNINSFDTLLTQWNEDWPALAQRRERWQRNVYSFVASAQIYSWMRLRNLSTERHNKRRRI